jgi:c-di-GMP-binding flagellar brake protein YcgR
MAKPVGKDRRNFVRISTDLPVRLMAPCSAAFACDMSTGGVGIIVKEQFPPTFERMKEANEPLKIEIDLPNGETITLAAEICWGRVESEGGVQSFRLGLQFIDMPPKVKRTLDAYLKDKALEHAFPEKKPPEQESD